MGQKGSGIERFLAPSVSKIGEELGFIREEIEKLSQKLGETNERIVVLEEEQKRLASKIDKEKTGLTTESKALIENINEMEHRDRDEIYALKRFMDVAQRRLVVLEAKMKELGQ